MMFEVVCRIILLSLETRECYHGVNQAGDVFIREAGEILTPNTRGWLTG